MAFNFAGLNLDAKRPFYYPGEKTSSTVADILSSTPKCFGFDCIIEGNCLFLLFLVPFILNQTEPAHLRIKGERHIRERFRLSYTHFFVMFDIFLTHIHICPVVHASSRKLPHSLF